MKIIRDGEEFDATAEELALYGDLAPPPPPPAVPSEVTNAQLRVALAGMELSPGVNAHDALHDHLKTLGGAAWLLWEYANVIERNGMLVASVAAGFGWSEEQLDALFTQAASIIG